MHPLLDNILWHSFTGSLAPFTTGTSRARRFSPGFPAILGFPDLHNPAFTDLTPHCAPGEHFYTGDWSGPVPAGWKIEEESSMFRMVLDPSTSVTDDSPDIVPLQPAHAAQALALATLTKPGPFGARTLELGEYFGCFDGPQLVAMAGERFHAGPYREISAVCTHPDYQGRGLARRLMNRLICRQRQRGETTFLHVMSGNDRAHAFYERFGFRNHLHTTVRVVTRI
jgi:ribosomal protein S18 acetylase RimI-like enzyme